MIASRLHPRIFACGELRKKLSERIARHNSSANNHGSTPGDVKELGNCAEWLSPPSAQRQGTTRARNQSPMSHLIPVGYPSAPSLTRCFHGTILSVYYFYTSTTRNKNQRRKTFFFFLFGLPTGPLPVLLSLSARLSSTHRSGPEVSLLSSD